MSADMLIAHLRGRSRPSRATPCCDTFPTDNDATAHNPNSSTCYGPSEPHEPSIDSAMWYLKMLWHNELAGLRNNPTWYRDLLLANYFRPIRRAAWFSKSICNWL